MDVLLPVCISIAVLGAVLAVVLWSRHRRGRALQAGAAGMLPFGLYLTGLLPLVWSGVIELVRWAGRIVFSPPVWAGIGLLGLTVVLWVVGGMLARRTQNRSSRDTTGRADRVGKPVTTGKSKSSPGSEKTASPPGGAQDSEFDDIEALLRKRGIE